MTTPLESLIRSGTKLWLDSIDPDLVTSNQKLGATGATSNPIIVANLIKTGRFDDQLQTLVQKGLDSEAIAWEMTDCLVRNAQTVFQPIYEETQGNDGYVSFELDPLLEDSELGPPHDERVSRYVQLAEKWSEGHANRMIKVPATPAGLAALDQIVAAGITVNVTLIFTDRQYVAARDAVWRGAQQRSDATTLKSVYSIFVSRVDVYTQKHVPELSADAQGFVGIVNAKRIWESNRQFWSSRDLPLAQEMIFASTGTKNPEDDAWKYVAAFAGSDIETNPPATNDAVQASGVTFDRQVDILPPQNVLDEIDAKVDFAQLEETLMAEGLQKFADPQKALLALIESRRDEISTT